MIEVFFYDRTFIPSFDALALEWCIDVWTFLVFIFHYFSFKWFSSFWCNSEILSRYLLITRSTSWFFTNFIKLWAFTINKWLFQIRNRFLLNFWSISISNLPFIFSRLCIVISNFSAISPKLELIFLPDSFLMLNQLKLLLAKFRDA